MNIDKTQLKQNEHGHWLVKTRDGREAQIYTFKACGDYPIAGEIDGNHKTWTEKGMIFNDGNQRASDLILPEQWTLSRSVNGFTLVEGQEWHRQDWTKDMLPEGWRPTIKGEMEKEGDQWFVRGKWKIISHGHVKSRSSCNSCHSRTRRPLPEVKKPVLTQEQIADGWIEWHGGECPVWGGSKPEVMFRDGGRNDKVICAKWNWNHIGTKNDIIAYRPDPYEHLKKAHSEGKAIQCKAGSSWIDIDNPVWDGPVADYRINPAPVMVPLGPEDVPPGSVIRKIKGAAALWTMVAAVSNEGVKTSRDSFGDWVELQSDYEISRDGGKTWQKCEKEAK